MRWSSDRTGFPVLEVPGTGMCVQLLPIAKVQWEIFLSETDRFGDGHYQELLTVLPRVSWRAFSDEEREQAFLGGVCPKEAQTFASWMQEGMRLPTTEEWRCLYSALERRSVDKKDRRALFGSCTSEPSMRLVEQVWDQLGPRVWTELMLLDGGLHEWAEDRNGFVGLGRPRHAFLATCTAPTASTTPLPGHPRAARFGFRLVRASGGRRTGARRVT